MTDIVGEDLIVLVDDPNGTPTSKKARVSSLLSSPANDDSHSHTPGVSIPSYPSAVTDHGDLSGLSDNDHPQYLMKSGNINEIVTRSHSSLQDIGTKTHDQIDTHINSTSNPHSVTNAQVGLSNVINSLQLVASNNLWIYNSPQKK